MNAAARPCPHGVPDGEDCMLCCREGENKVFAAVAVPARLLFPVGDGAGSRAVAEACAREFGAIRRAT